MRVLEFCISDLRVGVDIADVVEAVRAVEITSLPGAPKVVEGLIDYRGTVAPVFDLRLRLMGTHMDITPAHQLILVRSAGRLVALHVDTVTGLVDVDAAAVSTTASEIPGSSHVAGVAALPDGLLLIQDVATFLSAAERDTLDGALDALAPLAAPAATK